MKYILILLFLPISLFSQTNKNEVIYEDGILTQEVIQNHLSFAEKEKVIQNKVLGINVRVTIDTVFKKYTVTFTDQDQKKRFMWFNFLQNAFQDKDRNYSSKNIYMMEDMNKDQWFLIDFLNIFYSKELIISQDKLLPNNCTFLYIFKNARQVNHR